MLAEWWGERFAAADEAKLESAIEELSRFGVVLGDEIAVAVDAGAAGATAPLLLAEARDPESFSTLLDAEIARLTEGAQSGGRLVRIVDPRTAPPLSEHALGVWLAGDLVAASPRLDRLVALADALSSGARPFVGTPFQVRLAESYGEGAGWLIGVDVAALLAEERADPGQGPALERLGLAQVEHLILESESFEGTAESRATVAFAGERQGIASWLAAPAPVGALDFVSPNAQVAVGGLFKEPVGMFDDLLALVAEQDDPALSGLAEFEAKTGLAVREDLAAAFGGDAAFAIDGPWLPTPAWKLVVEVADQARLMETARRLVEAWNREAESASRPALRFVQEEAGGRVVYTLERTGGGALASFLFADGYLVAGPAKALLAEAVAQRAAGVTLTASSPFRERLPRDGRTDYSAVAWQSLGGSLGSIAALLGGQLDDAERARLEAAGAATGPTLGVAYAEADRLIFATGGGGGPLGLSLESLLGLAVRPPHPAPEAPAESAGAPRHETPARRAA